MDEPKPRGSSKPSLSVNVCRLDYTTGHKNRPTLLGAILDLQHMCDPNPLAAVRGAVRDSSFLIFNEDDEVTRKQPLSDMFTNDI